MGIKAFGYVRVSGKGQLAGDGFTRQREAIAEYTAINGIDLVQVFEEKGVTGSKETMDRPAFIEMITALMSDGVKTVIIERLDRLSRDLIVQETAIKDFQRQGLTILSTESGEENLMVDKSDDPTRVLVRRILGAIADYDKSMIVAKLRAARMRNKAYGKRQEGMKPFGSRPEEQTAVAALRTLARQGLAHSAIAVRMNADGIPARTSASGRVGKWHATSVRRVLAANQVA